MGVAPSLGAPSTESHPFRTEMPVSSLPPRQCEGLKGCVRRGDKGPGSVCDARAPSKRGGLDAEQGWSQRWAGRRSHDTPTVGGRPREDRRGDPRFALRRGGGTAVTTGQTPVCGLALPPCCWALLSVLMDDVGQEMGAPVTWREDGGCLGRSTSGQVPSVLAGLCPPPCRAGALPAFCRAPGPLSSPGVGSSLRGACCKSSWAGCQLPPSCRRQRPLGSIHSRAGRA